jgi:protein-L-isoaspartate(D-aspartate) O-methyltransferase
VISAVTAVMHRLVGEKGLVVGIDHLQPLTSMSERNLKADNVDINTGNGESGVKIITGDGRRGYSTSGS